MEPDERIAHTGLKVDPVVELARVVLLVTSDDRLLDALVPADAVEELVPSFSDPLHARKRVLDQLPLDEVDESSPSRWIRSPRAFDGARRVCRERRAEGSYPRDDFCLFIVGVPALSQDGHRPIRVELIRRSLRPVELD